MTPAPVTSSCQATALIAAPGSILRVGSVVSQQRHLIAGLIVAELLQHRNGERHRWMSLLPAVKPARQALNAIHRCAGDA
jgi:hypothetical protein